MTALPANRAQATLFGIPIGDFGAFATVLISVSIGMVTFFLVTFFSIFGIMIYNGFGHHLTYAASYKWVALPAGILMLLASLTYLGSLWLRRKFRGGAV